MFGMYANPSLKSWRFEILNLSVALIVPTLNAGVDWPRWIECVKAQGLAAGRVLVIDSSSSDDTVAKARDAGFRVRVIPRSEFNHGGTRMLALDELPDADLLVYLTQDALLADDGAVSSLVASFADERVGAAFGRQLPHTGATPIGTHARLFNYPEKGRVVGASDVPQLGLKTAFISNSFAAYRRSALLSVGGFPLATIMNEDTFTAGRLILSGWKIAYCVEARVYHSHDYTVKQDFKRYFDIGVFHAQQPWMRKELGAAEGEGSRFVKSEMRYLLNRAPWLLPSAVLRTFAKYLGYRAGLLYRALPLRVVRRSSMNRGYWK